MKIYLRVFASAILLSGCANGAIMPTGTGSSADYGLLVKGLRCEVEDLVEYDRTSPDAPKFFFTKDSERYVSILVEIDGEVSSKAGLSGSVKDYGIGAHKLFSASAGVDISNRDTGSIIMGDSVVPNKDKAECTADDRKHYNFNRLGLLPWYKNIAARTREHEGGKLLSKLTFKRDGTVAFGPNGASVSFFNPGSVVPSAEFKISNEVKITIELEDKPTTPKVALNDATIAALAEALGTQGKPAPRHRRSGPASGLPTPAEKAEGNAIRDLDEKLNDVDTLIKLNRL